MCGSCWDVDDMEEKLKKNLDACDGLEMPIMTLDELKMKLFEKSIHTNKSSFRVFRKAVPEVKESSLSWKAPNTITVHFI